MDILKVQDVVCPFCKSRYMVRIYDDCDATLIGETTKNGWFYTCHKCDGYYFIAKGNKFGIDISSVPKENIITNGLKLR